MCFSSKVLEEDLATKEATEWGLELISVLLFLSRCTKISIDSKKCPEAIYLESVTTSNSAKTEHQ